jgi:hypothetical protein
MQAFRTILVPKVARSSPNGPGGGADAPTGSQGRPQSSHLEPKVGPETPPESQNGPPWRLLGRLWGPFARLLGALGVFWGHFGHLGVSVTTFCVLRLNQGKPRICWKNVVQAHTGATKMESFWAFLGQKSAQSRHTGPQTCKRANRDPDKRPQRPKEGPKEPIRPPKAEKGEIWGHRRGGPGTPGTPRNPPAPPPHSLSAEPPRRHPLPQSLRLLKTLKETLRLLKV